MATSLNPADVAAKWAKNTAGATQAYKDGVAAVKESPTKKAAEAADRYVSGVQRAVEEGSYQDGLLSVSLQEWQRLATEKGAPRIATGVKEATPKVMEVMQQLLPYTARVSEEVQAMPRGGPAESLARMTRNFELMSQFRVRRRRT